MATEQLILKINVKGGQASKRDIDRAVKSAERLKKAFREAQAAGGGSGWKRIHVNLNDISKSVKKTERSVSLLTRTFRSLAALHIAGRAFSFFARMAQDAAKTVDAYTLLQNRIRAVVPDLSEVGVITKKIVDLSIEGRTPLVETAQIYSRLAVAARDLGISQQESIDITDTLMKTIKLSGTAAQEGTKALIQFTQAIASNRFSADELRSVTEQLPRLADIVARHLGITRGELKQWGEAGKLTTKIMVEAVKSAADDIDAEFKNLVPTLEESWEVLTTVVKEFVGEMDRSTGFSAAFADTLINISTQIRGMIPAFKDLAFVIAESFGASSPILLNGNEIAMSMAKMLDDVEAWKRLVFGLSEEDKAYLGSSKDVDEYIARLSGPGHRVRKLTEMQEIRAEAERLQAAFGSSGITDGINLEDQGIDRTPAAKTKKKKRGRKPFTFEDALKEIQTQERLGRMRDAERQAESMFLRLKKRLTENITQEEEKQLQVLIRRALDTDRKVELEIQQEITDAVKEQGEASKLVNKLLDEEMEKIREKEAMAQKMRDAVKVVMAQRRMNSTEGTFDAPWVDFDKETGDIQAKQFTEPMEHLANLFGPDGPIIRGLEGMNDSLADVVAHGIVFSDSTKEWNENLRNAAKTIQTQLLSALLSLPGQIVSDSIRNSISGSVASGAKGAVAGAVASTLTSRKSGGYTGDYGVNDIVGYHHGQEFVMPAEQTRKFRSDLESMKAGNKPTGNYSGTNVQVNVINQAGNNLDFETKMVDEKTIEIIAKRQVEKHAEKIVAGAISDPYSKTSKALGRHTNTRRVR